MATPVTTWADFFVDAFRRVPLMVILRGMSPDHAVTAARTAWHAGVGLVEVTIETEDALPTLAAVVRAAPDGVPVGAGTVTTPDRLAAAVEVGARFGVAPGLDADTVRAARERDVPFLPGIATPTEAGQALRLGATTVKVFPAATLGPSWVGAIAGPFPGLRMVATGGVTAATAPEYLRAGAIAVGVGSSLGAGAGLANLVEAARSP
ncbi:MAG: 2-dehydro-3-deoxyphosphogluconate aldolase [Actinophytocola sp.]|nr:2-dehydro-3-deoxyphosphogluconate aldolase [Actinophytocola sp.]